MKARTIPAVAAFALAGAALAPLSSLAKDPQPGAKPAATMQQTQTQRPAAAAVAKPLPGQITGLNFTKPQYEPTEAVAYTVQGSGPACRFHLTFKPAAALATAPSTANSPPPPQPPTPPELTFPKFGQLPFAGTQNEGIGAGLIKPWSYLVVAEATAEDQAKGDACTGKAYFQVRIGSAGAALATETKP